MSFESKVFAVAGFGKFLYVSILFLSIGCGDLEQESSSSDVVSTELSAQSPTPVIAKIQLTDWSDELKLGLYKSCQFKTELQGISDECDCAVEYLTSMDLERFMSNTFFVFENIFTSPAVAECIEEKHITN